MKEASQVSISLESWCFDNLTNEWLHRQRQSSHDVIVTPTVQSSNETSWDQNYDWVP